MLGPDLRLPASLDAGVALGLFVHCRLALAGLRGHERLSGPVGGGDLGGGHGRHPLPAGCPLDGRRRLLALELGAVVGQPLGRLEPTWPPLLWAAWAFAPSSLSLWPAARFWWDALCLIGAPGSLRTPRR